MLNKLSRHQLLQIVIGYTLMLLAFKWYNGVLPFQLANAPLFDVSIDNTFWLFHLTGIPKWIIQQKVLLIVLEVVLVFLGIASIVKSHKYYCIAFLVLYVFLDLLQQTYTGTLTKTSVIFPMVFLPFCFSKALFSFVWKLPRYYLVYLMFSAALFKILNGGLMHANQMVDILANQHLDLHYFENHHISKTVSGWLSNHSTIANISYWIISVLELSFIALLLTTKADKLLAICLVFFCVSIYFTLRINTLEILYLVIPLLPHFKINE
ncbi:MAG: hypothetical protein R2753_12320 [Chitinophagales bacterium]